MPDPRRILDFWLPLGLLAALAVFYLVTLPETFYWIENTLDWVYAAEMLRAGQLAPHGSSIVGMGHNGPLVIWYFQLALWLHFGEWTVPVATSLAALAAVAWTAWLLARRRDDRPWAWTVLIVASCPILFECSRIGMDLSLLPVTMPLTLVAWQTVQRGRARRLPWYLGGLALAVGTQIYVIYSPAAMVVGLALAGSAWRRYRRAAWRPWLLLLAGFLTVQLPVALAGFVQPRAYEYGSLDQTLAVIWQMFSAYPLQFELRAEAVAPLLRGPITAVGWATMAAPFVAAVVLRRRLSTLEWCAVWIAAVSHLAISYPDEVRYHYIVHFLVVFAVSQSMLARLVLLDRTRLAALAVVAVQVAFLVFVQRDARETGFVTLANSFPVTTRGQTYLASTLRTRAQLKPVLHAAGLTTTTLRHAFIHGDRVLPFLENAWIFLDDAEYPSDSAPVSTPEPGPVGAPGDREYFLEACPQRAPGVHLAPRLCWRSQWVRPVRVYAGASTQALSLHRFRAESTPYQPHSFQWLQSSGRARIDVRNARSLTIRGARPIMMPPYNMPGTKVVEPELPLLARRNAQMTFEETYGIPAGVDEVRLWLEMPPYLEFDVP